MELSPYLSFNGECEVAFEFYERCLGGKIVAMMTYGGSPMEEQTPAEWRNKATRTGLLLPTAVSSPSTARASRSNGRITEPGATLATSL